MATLADRDVNIQSPSKTFALEKAANPSEKAMQPEAKQYKSLLNRKNVDGSGLYISPSDAILSPASQKLSGMKQRQINRQSGKGQTARTLFARTASDLSTASDSEAAKR